MASEQPVFLHTVSELTAECREVT